MNKLSIMTKIAMITLGMIGISHADHQWTGFYAGLGAGIVMNNTQLKSQQLGFTNPSNACQVNSDFSTFSPSIQFGYTYQFSNSFVSGIEVNAIFNTNQTKTLSCHSSFNPSVYDRFIARNQMQTSIKGRAGSILNWNETILYPYLTVGASFATTELTYKNEGSDYYSNSTNQAGWLIGAGVEWPFWQHYSLRAEYFYANYGNAINLALPSIYGLDDPNGHATLNLSSNNIMITLNYWI